MTYPKEKVGPLFKDYQEFSNDNEGPLDKAHSLIVFCPVKLFFQGTAKT